jgi:hypothetical protein
VTQQLENHTQSQTESQTESQTAQTMPQRSPVPIPPALHLPSETVRALVAHLTEAEDVLRDLEPFVLRNARLVVNPARQPWIARERALVAELRSRRTAWRRGDLPGLVMAPRR